MSNYQFKTNSDSETIELAEKLASLLSAGDVITLEGQLGTGKTTFTKGIAKGLGVKRTVSSPTFTIVKEYEGTSLWLYHIDAYRLEHSDEDIGFGDYFNGNGITVVEWAVFIEDFLPKERLAIKINYVNEHAREFEITANSEYFEQVINELMS